MSNVTNKLTKALDVEYSVIKYKHCNHFVFGSIVYVMKYNMPSFFRTISFKDIIENDESTF
jgi:hypothetical protein